jgi:hypothetical protein
MLAAGGGEDARIISKVLIEQAFQVRYFSRLQVPLQVNSATWPHWLSEMVRVICSRCDRKDQDQKETVLALHEPYGRLRYLKHC